VQRFAKHYLELHSSPNFAPSEPTPAQTTSEPERREKHTVNFNSREDWLKWLTKS
jgi:hypothetical protein